MKKIFIQEGMLSAKKMICDKEINGKAYFAIEFDKDGIRTGTVIEFDDKDASKLDYEPSCIFQAVKLDAQVTELINDWATKAMKLASKGNLLVPCVVYEDNKDVKLFGRCPKEFEKERWRVTVMRLFCDCRLGKVEYCD